tara:strand:- start:499 stop:1263 length:765 start_codon:yes stop_codon:yes gene_type:complete
VDLTRSLRQRKERIKKDKEVNRLKRVRIEQNKLLELAKHTIIAELSNLSFDKYVKQKFGVKEGKKVKTNKFDSMLKYWGKTTKGVTVSIFIGNEFRGSNGSVKSIKNVYDDVIDFTYKTAFNDIRFPRLKKKDFDKGIRIEIYLTDHKETPIYYNDPLELLILLDKSKNDGFLVRRGSKEDYYLPDTWREIPNPSMFISSLCNKAGLPPGSWKGESRLWPGKTKVRRQNLYTGEVIEQETIGIYSLKVDSIIGK